MISKITRYIIVSPVRNEEKYIEYTLRSVLMQTIHPQQWIIVNDGSTDKTREIVETFTREHHWIRLINLADRGYSEPGRGVIEAFYAGYEQRDFDDYEFIVKLDADLSFQENYFECLFQRFALNPKLGMASGICMIMRNGRLVRENHPAFHVRGPSKVYRLECWQSIGGVVKHLGWDIFDEVKANYLGWETRSFSDLRIVHHRVTGYNTGVFKWAIKLGLANYYTGYHPLFVLAKGIRRMWKRPYLINGIGILCGYFGGYIMKTNRIVDKELMKYIRKQQIRRLTFRSGIWH